LNDRAAVPRALLRSGGPFLLSDVWTPSGRDRRLGMAGGGYTQGDEEVTGG